MLLHSCQMGISDLNILHLGARRFGEVQSMLGILPCEINSEKGLEDMVTHYVLRETSAGTPYLISFVIVPSHKPP